jgi:hypothetical protein
MPADVAAPRGFLTRIWQSVFPACEAVEEEGEPEEVDGCVEQREEEEETANTALNNAQGSLKSKEAPFPFSNYQNLIPSQHSLKYTWTNKVSPVGGGAAAAPSSGQGEQYLRERRQQKLARIYS